PPRVHTPIRITLLFFSHACTPTMPCSVEGAVYSDARRLRKVRPPTMRAAMERREAPGLLARARAPRDPHRPQPHLGPGSSACRPADRKAGLREPIARLPGRLPALHPSPMERGGKQGDGPARGPKEH